MTNIQEMSFQNVVDTILKPEGVHVGGYPDELFLDMSENEREQWQCNICYMVSRGAQQCDNKHLFCGTCVFAWSMTYGANSDKCPVCRTKQNTYSKNGLVDEVIGRKRVKCPEIGCGFRAPLHYFLKHSHGMKVYHSDVDLDSLQRSRPPPMNSFGGSGLFFLPSVRTTGRGTPQEGSNLLQDMMLVLHLEMELRRRAIERFATEHNDAERIRHMSEVLAIQEQMQEITGFLQLIFSIPPQQRVAPVRHPMHVPSHNVTTDDTDESDDSESSESPTTGYYSIFSQNRLSIRGGQPSLQRALASPSAVSDQVTLESPSATRTSAPTRQLRRSEIRDSVQRNPSEEPASRPRVLEPLNNVISQRRADDNRHVSVASATADRLVNSTPADSTLLSRDLGVTRLPSVPPPLEITSTPSAMLSARSHPTLNTPVRNPPALESPSYPSTMPAASAETQQFTSQDTLVRGEGDYNQLVERVQHADTRDSSAITSHAPNIAVNTPFETLLPPASLDFQHALQGLPEASAQEPVRADYALNANGNDNDIAHSSISQPLTISHRPVPPTGQGLAVNTRPRLRSSSLAAPVNSVSVHELNGASPRPAQGTSVIGRSGATGSSQEHSVRPRAHTRGRTLPSTPGQLLRTRRRSEIQQQLQEQLNKDPPADR